MLKISDVPIISLDLETSGLIPGKHVPLSIGAVVLPDDSCDGTYEVNDKNSFYTQLEWNTVVVDRHALRINKLDIVNPPGETGCIDNCSISALAGLMCFSDWVIKYGGTSPVFAFGMNVGSFDLPMLRSVWQLTETTWPFHYLSIDLNGLFFALSNIQNRPFDTIKQKITQIAWDRNTAFVGMKHHALANAWSNIYVWEECLKQFSDYEILC
jgi:DNA polymerase III epsilon subunit-like protein